MHIGPSSPKTLETVDVSGNSKEVSKNTVSIQKNIGTNSHIAIDDTLGNKALKLFCNKEITDRYGVIDRERLHKMKGNLPFFGPKQIHRLQEVLFSECEILFKDKSIRVSINFLDIARIVEQYVLEKGKKGLQVHLVGGIVPYILGIQYFVAALELLSCEEIGALLTEKMRKEFEDLPPDVDIRIICDELDYFDIQAIEKLIVEYILNKVNFAGGTQRDYSYIDKNAFTKKTHWSDGLSDYLATAYSDGKGKCVDNLIVKKLARNHLFSRDYLFIDVDLGKCDQNTKTCAAKICDQNTVAAWQAMISRLTKTIHISELLTVNQDGWLMLMSYLSRGYTFPSPGVEMELRTILQRTLSFSKSPLEKLKALFVKTCVNHHSTVHISDDGANVESVITMNSSIMFLLNATYYMKGTYAFGKAFFLTTLEKCTRNDNENLFISIVYQLLTGTDVPLSIIHAYIVLAGNLRLLSGLGDQTVEYSARVYDGGEGLQLRVKDGEKVRTFIINNDVKQALETINNFSCPKEYQSLLSQLWETLCGKIEIANKQLSRVEYFPDVFFESEHLIDSCDLQLRKIGFDLFIHELYKSELIAKIFVVYDRIDLLCELDNEYILKFLTLLNSTLEVIAPGCKNSQLKYTCNHFNNIKEIPSHIRGALIVILGNLKQPDLYKKILDRLNPETLRKVDFELTVRALTQNYPDFTDCNLSKVFLLGLNHQVYRVNYAICLYKHLVDLIIQKNSEVRDIDREITQTILNQFQQLRKNETYVHRQKLVDVTLRYIAWVEKKSLDNATELMTFFFSSPLSESLKPARYDRNFTNHFMKLLESDAIPLEKAMIFWSNNLKEPERLRRYLFGNSSTVIIKFADNLFATEVNKFIDQKKQFCSLFAINDLKCLQNVRRKCFLWMDKVDETALKSEDNQTDLSLELLIYYIEQHEWSKVIKFIPAVAEKTPSVVQKFIAEVSAVTDIDAGDQHVRFTYINFVLKKIINKEINFSISCSEINALLGYISRFKDRSQGFVNTDFLFLFNYLLDFVTDASSKERNNLKIAPIVGLSTNFLKASHCKYPITDVFLEKLGGLVQLAVNEEEFSSVFEFIIQLNIIKNIGTIESIDKSIILDLIEKPPEVFGGSNFYLQAYGIIDSITKRARGTKKLNVQNKNKIINFSCKAIGDDISNKECHQIEKWLLIINKYVHSPKDAEKTELVTSLESWVKQLTKIKAFDQNSMLLENLQKCLSKQTKTSLIEDLICSYCNDHKFEEVVDYIQKILEHNNFLIKSDTVSKKLSNVLERLIYGKETENCIPFESIAKVLHTGIPVLPKIWLGYLDHINQNRENQDVEAVYSAFRNYDKMYVNSSKDNRNNSSRGECWKATCILLSGNLQCKSLEFFDDLNTIWNTFPVSTEIQWGVEVVDNLILKAALEIKQNPKKSQELQVIKRLLLSEKFIKSQQKLGKNKYSSYLTIASYFLEAKSPEVNMVGINILKCLVDSKLLDVDRESTITSMNRWLCAVGSYSSVSVEALDAIFGVFSKILSQVKSEKVDTFIFLAFLADSCTDNKLLDRGGKVAKEGNVLVSRSHGSVLEKIEKYIFENLDHTVNMLLKQLDLKTVSCDKLTANDHISGIFEKLISYNYFDEIFKIISHENIKLFLPIADLNQFSHLFGTFLLRAEGNTDSVDEIEESLIKAVQFYFTDPSKQPEYLDMMLDRLAKIMVEFQNPSKFCELLVKLTYGCTVSTKPDYHSFQEIISQIIHEPYDELSRRNRIDGNNVLAECKEDLSHAANINFAVKFISGLVNKMLSFPGKDEHTTYLFLSVAYTALTEICKIPFYINKNVISLVDKFIFSPMAFSSDYLSALHLKRRFNLYKRLLKNCINIDSYQEFTRIALFCSKDRGIKLFAEETATDIQQALFSNIRWLQHSKCVIPYDWSLMSFVNLSDIVYKEQPKFKSLIFDNFFGSITAERNPSMKLDTTLDSIVELPLDELYDSSLYKNLHDFKELRQYSNEDVSTQITKKINILIDMFKGYQYTPYCSDKVETFNYSNTLRIEFVGKFIDFSIKMVEQKNCDVDFSEAALSILFCIFEQNEELSKISMNQLFTSIVKLQKLTIRAYELNGNIHNLEQIFELIKIYSSLKQDSDKVFSFLESSWTKMLQGVDTIEVQGHLVKKK
ncbi:MAG: hypothetical protein VX777_06745 [Chlamydiota bacterium]|nr:hypothetical protein [Chlamydiota bacterium]